MKPMQSDFMDSLQRTRITPATTEDEDALWLMLTYAASMGRGGLDEVERARSDPYLSTYGTDWGRKAGDVGVIARDALGHPIGAAWLRLSHSEAPWRVADLSAPELAMAVLPHARGRGVGSAMMQSLIALAAPTHQQITLSVRVENPARRFYARLGFIEVSKMKNRVGGDSIVMILDLRAANPQKQPSQPS